jgi:hypothetical protein
VPEAATATPDATPQGGEQAPAPAASTPDFSWAGEQFVGEDGFKTDEFRAYYEELLAERARAGEKPQAPEAYEFTVPEDIDFGDMTLPEGFKPEIDPKDPTFQPMFDEFSQLLKDNGLPQEAASGFMGLLAKYEAGQQAKIAQAHQAEMQKLGTDKAQVSARLSTAQRALQGRVGEDAAGAIMKSIQSFEAFRALEKLLAPQGGSAPIPQPKTATVDPIAARYPNSRKD